MVDVQTVLERLKALKSYRAELDYYTQYSLRELISDFVKYRAVERSLQLAAQTVVNIATHIISADYNTRVEDYREAIEGLGKEGILPAEFAGRLAPIANFSNILVHEYLAVDPAKLYDALINGRKDLEEFSQRIARYLQRTGALEDEILE